LFRRLLSNGQDGKHEEQKERESTAHRGPPRACEQLRAGS
jgi:hypothetical protein